MHKALEGWQGSDDDGDIVRNWCPPKYPTNHGAVECLALKSNPLDFTRATSFDTSPMCVGKGTMPNGFIDSRSFAMRGELPATRVRARMMEEGWD